MLRRLLLTTASAAATLTALSAVPPAAYATAVPPSTAPAAHGGDDHLTVAVHGIGTGQDGTYELSCHPSGGTHPDARDACDLLDRRTTWGRDPFAPMPEDTLCTMQYGGPAAARITGTWAGRPVDATYERGDGCQIKRWDALVPLLPDLSEH